MPPVPPGLELADLLLLTVLAGACGGVVSVCTKLTLQNGVIVYDGQARARFGTTILMLLTSVIAGAASAVCLLFLFHFLQLLKTDNTVDNKIFLLSGSLIAGIAAQRLIPRYTRSLEAKLDALDKTTEETREVAQEATIITKAQASLNPIAPLSQKLAAVELLKEQTAKAPLDRTATIYLGRLYRKLERWSDAIAALDTFIRNKEQAKQLDKDYADAYYNRACYMAQLWLHEKDPKTKAEALDDLRKAVQYSADNKEDAATDDDFAELKEDEEFKKIVS